MNRKLNHWHTLRRKTTRMAMERAVDALADLIEVIHNRGEQDRYNTAEIENLINKLRRIVEVIE